MRIIRPFRDQLSDARREIQRQYDDRYRRYAARHELCARRARLWSWARLFAFTLAAAFLFVSLTRGRIDPWGSLSIACLAAFLGAVVQHLRVEAESARQRTLATINAEAGHRLYRRWDKIRQQEPSPTPVEPVELKDLHIIGEGSLTHWLSTVVTSIGKQRLLEWLMAPGNAIAIEQRQTAASELAPALDHRQQFFATSEPLRRVVEDDAGLLLWTQGPLDKMPPYPAVLLLSLTTVVAVIADVLGFTPIHWWVPLVILNVMISMRFGGSLRREMSLVDRANMRLKCYSELIRQASAHPHQAPLLSEIQQCLRFNNNGQINARPVNHLIDQLQRRVAMAELRHFGLYYLFAQPLLLWDFHCIHALRSWRDRYGPHVKSWLDALATYEVLCTVASVRYDEPDWCFPALDSDALTFRANELGHPLISGQKRVCNDVQIGPDRRLLLLTGSNMSGKSTLLRTIGCNIILARCGAPVCGTVMQCPPIRILSSFHVEDSLNEATSLFMAELLRVKSIIEEAERNTVQGMPTLYLLDELLHGTNSQERSVAVTIILEKLLSLRTLGVISTHDMQLARSSELREKSSPFHFREYIEHERDEMVMRFDYRLRKGQARSTNALALFRGIGISDRPSVSPPAGDSRWSAG